MRRKVLAAILAAIVILISTVWSFHRSLQNGMRWTCDVVHEAYYRKTPELDQWLEDCRRASDELPKLSLKKDAIAVLNSELAELRVSHLSIYTQEQNEEMWENTAVDNGLRVRTVDGEFIVMGIVPESAAANSEIKIGDEIAKINGESPLSAYDLQSESGEFEIQTYDGKVFIVSLEATQLSEDLSPTIRQVSNGNAILKIASFLPQYFDREDWIKIASELSRYKHIIIDLRDNSGGSFVGMLRAASPFFCKPTSIGLVSSSIEDGKNTSQVQGSLVDDIEARAQIEQLVNESSLQLRTYEDYGCTGARVTVLVNSDTASTAEVFAYAMSLRENSRVWGVPTAGEVVVARWFELSPFGFNRYSLSVPVAGFTTNKGLELEHEGIMPSRLLFYNLEESRRGRDNWVSTALQD